jgi:hypothetical protein
MGKREQEAWEIYRLDAPTHAARPVEFWEELSPEWQRHYLAMRDRLAELFRPEFVRETNGSPPRPSSHPEPQAEVADNAASLQVSPEEPKTGTGQGLESKS